MEENIVSVNQKKFTIEKLLGKGKGGYSYLVSFGKAKYVVKQIHHEPCDYYTFGNKLEAEVKAYQKLKTIGIPMPKLYDVDVEKELILKEYIEGDTVFDLVAMDKMNESYLKQVQEMCQLLYPLKMNIDYFPTNFIVKDNQLYYIDYECNEYMNEWNFENWGAKYWSKTPEFLFYVNKDPTKEVLPIFDE